MTDTPELAGPVRQPIARRSMMTGLMTGLTLATTRVEAQAIHTDSAGLVAGEVKVKVADGEIPAYAARPQGDGPFPVVLVNEEVYGVHEYMKDICRRLAKEGYLAVAPEIYARAGDMSKVDDFAGISRDIISKTPDAQVMADLDSTVAWAAANKGDVQRLGTVGFCRGGRTVWLYDAHSPALKAAVSWYGIIGGATSAVQPKTAMDVAADIHAPLLALQGDQDAAIRVQDVEAAAAKARAAGKTVSVVVYSGAGHGFHADYRPSYRAADAADGWKRTLAWLRRYGVA